ncbi:hypothetical protein HYQ46_001693 [Verticillium longisporum]|nr:hypothetical protein HYQ44_010483 [Verticillium longisporum]KAG7149399.1 hypothetical protein HYQ46_001693 [Verticillium longisporum]
MSFRVVNDKRLRLLNGSKFPSKRKLLHLEYTLDATKRGTSDVLRGREVGAALRATVEYRIADHHKWRSR